MTRLARAATLAMVALLLMASVATAGEDPRALVVEGEELLAANQAPKALETFRRVRALLGTTPPRLQADLVRAAAAVGDDVLTQTEHAAWLRLGRRDPAVDAELLTLVTRATERISAREQTQSAAAVLIENERRIRAEETRTREAEAISVREADVQFAAQDAQRAMDSRNASTAEDAIKRIDRVSALYPDHPRVGELGRLRANLVVHAALMHQAAVGVAEAAAQQRAAERRQKARALYALGAVKLVGGLAITIGGVSLLVVQPQAMGRSASIGLGIGSVCLGLGLAAVSAPASFRAGMQARAATSWSFAAATLPGGGFVGASRAF